MQLAELRKIYDAEGPYATVYLETQEASEDATKQIELRWNNLKETLEEQQAPEELLDAVEQAILAEDSHEVAREGRVLVAAASGVLLNEGWDPETASGDSAVYLEEPALGLYVRHAAQGIKMLVAITDREGAAVRKMVATASTQDERGQEQEAGYESSESVQKPRGGALSHNQIQRRAEEAVQQNARGIAEHLEKTARSWNPDVLILAGEVQGRTALAAELPPALEEIKHDVERGGAQDERAEDALADELQSIAADLAVKNAADHAGRFEQAKAHNLAVEGIDAVAHAAGVGAVETLLLGTETANDQEANVLAACVRTDSELELMDLDAQDGVAAVLRFDVSDFPGS